MSSFNPYNNTFNEPHTNRSKPSHQVLYHTRQPQQQPHPTHPSNTSSSNMSAWDPCVYRGYDSAQKLSDNSGVFDNNVWPLFPLNSTEENDPSAAPFHGQQTQRIAQNSLQQNPFSAQYALEGTPNCRSAHFLGSLEASPITAAPDTLAQSSILHPQPLLRIEQEIEAPPAIKLNVCDVCHDFVSSFASYNCIVTLSPHPQHCANPLHGFPPPVNNPPSHPSCITTSTTNSRQHSLLPAFSPFSPASTIPNTPILTQSSTSSQLHLPRNLPAAIPPYFYCPHVTCPRNRPGNGFKHKGRQDRHIRTVHGVASRRFANDQAPTTPLRRTSTL